MIVKNIDGIVKTTLVEPKVNHTASSWLIENRSMIIKHLATKGIIDKADDLYEDVYISLITAENDGNGYDMNYMQNSMITVEAFVMARVNRYAKSKKYRSDCIDSKSYVMTVKDTVRTPKIGIDGKPIKDDNGRIVYVTEVTSRKTKISCTTYAATPIGTDDEITAENSTAFKYSNAVSESAYADIQNVEDTLSLQGSIDLCIDIADKYGVDILGIFKRIDVIGEALASIKAKRDEALEAFRKIGDIAKENDEFRSALEEVLSYSESNKETFKGILAKSYN